MSALSAAKKAEGNKFFASKQYKDAIRCYSEAIAEDSNNHILYSNRAMAYSALQQWKEAKEDGLKCIALDKTFLKGYHRAANAMINLNEFIEAEDTLRKGLTYNTNDANLLALLQIAEPKAKALREEMIGKLPPLEKYKAQGNEFFKNSKFVEAIKSYTNAINSAGSNAEMNETLLACYNNRAACNQQLGNYEQVIEDSSHVIEYDPKNVKALLRRGLAFESLERYRSALEDIRAVLAINPTIDMANKAQHRIGTAVRVLKQQQ